jgi:hypothetical protein
VSFAKVLLIVADGPASTSILQFGQSDKPCSRRVRGLLAFLRGGQEGEGPDDRDDVQGGRAGWKGA